MSALDSLRSAYNDAVSLYNNAKTAGESYRQEAKKIKKIYDELLEKKADMINNKDSLTSYIDTEYNDWKGKLWSDNYMKDMSALLDSYSVVIQNIDANLDALNLKRTEYLNKAAEQFGILGRAESAINNLRTQIDNFTN